MPRQTATTAKPLSLAERKECVAELVEKGQLSPSRAKLIEFREPTARERSYAETLAPKARAALARGARRAA